MNKDRSNANVMKKRNIRHHLLFQMLVRHRVAAVLDHHRAPEEFAHVRQRFDEHMRPLGGRDCV